MKNAVSRLVTAASVFALTLGATGVLVGCEDKPAAPTSTPSAPTTPTEQPKAETPAEAPKPVPEPTPAPEAPKGEGRASVEGTVNMFIAAMQKRDYDAALECLDPASEGYKNINEINTQIKTNTAIPEEAKEIVKSFLSSGYAGITTRDLVESGDRARVTFVPKEGEAVTCEMNKLDGKWFIIAPQNIVVSKPAVPPPSPAPAPAPAPAPGTGGGDTGNPK